MADWNVAWEPSAIEFSPVFDTRVTEYGGGVMQYASKRANPAYRFLLHFNMKHMEPADLHAIRAFFIARKGMYEGFTFPNFAENIRGEGLALVAKVGEAAAYLTDSASGILTAGFRASGKVTIYGSATGGNNKVCDVSGTTGPAAGTLTLAADETLTADSANANLRIYNTYDVHFANDELWQSSVNRSIGIFKTIELYAEAY